MKKIMKVAIILAALGSSTTAAAQSLGARQDYFKAVRESDGATVSRLIDTPGSSVINMRERKNGDTALHLKTRARALNWMIYLLDKGADPNIASFDGDTPLHSAVQLDFVEGAKTLLAYDANVDARTSAGETPLIRAVRLRNPEMVKLLIRNGANPDTPDNATGRSARDYAAEDPRGRAMLQAIDQVEAERSTLDTDDKKQHSFDFSGDFLPVD